MRKLASDACFVVAGVIVLTLIVWFAGFWFLKILPFFYGEWHRTGNLGFLVVHLITAVIALGLLGAALAPAEDKKQESENADTTPE